MHKLKCKKIDKINVLVFIIFLLFSLLVGSKHEPWADEAQSWIIARDASYSEIVWNIARYEGSFPLWQITLKTCILMGLKYEYLFIIPIIISAIGLIIFLRKVEAPRYVKILLPFTYYIFYQYTIIARSYCYLLIAFPLLIVTYKRRTEKPLNYVLSLIIMSLISMHGMIISGILAILFFIEVVKQKKIKKTIIDFCILGLIFLVEIIILFPPTDLYMTVAASFSFLQIIKSILDSIIIGNGNIVFKIYNLITVCLLLLAFSKMFNLKNKDTIITMSILFIFMFIIRFASHHSGILFLLIMFGIISYYDEIIEKNKKFDKLLIVVLILYTVLSIQSGINDYRYEYSGAKEMASYIEKMKYDEKKIVGFGFKDISLQPYFEKKLYTNWDETIYRWSYKNKDFYTYCNIGKIDRSEFTDVPEYIVLEWDENDSKIKLIEQYIKESNKYEIEYRTKGYEFFKNSYSETEGYTLYKLKN